MIFVFFRCGETVDWHGTVQTSILIWVWTDSRLAWNGTDLKFELCFRHGETAKLHKIVHGFVLGVETQSTAVEQ